MSEYEAKANPKGGWNIKKIKEENPKPPKKMSYEYKLFILCQRSHDKNPDVFNRMMKKMVEEHEREITQAEDNMRKRCVEALPKKSYINYHIEGGMTFKDISDAHMSMEWEQGFNTAIDQATQNINNLDKGK